MSPNPIPMQPTQPLFTSYTPSLSQPIAKLNSSSNTQNSISTPSHNSPSPHRTTNTTETTSNSTPPTSSTDDILYTESSSQTMAATLPQHSSKLGLPPHPMVIRLKNGNFKPKHSYLATKFLVPNLVEPSKLTQALKHNEWCQAVS